MFTELCLSINHTIFVVQESHQDTIDVLLDNWMDSDNPLNCQIVEKKIDMIDLRDSELRE